MRIASGIGLLHKGHIYASGMILACIVKGVIGIADLTPVTSGISGYGWFLFYNEILEECLLGASFALKEARQERKNLKGTHITHFTTN